MRHAVDIDYNLEPLEMLGWLYAHIGGPIDCSETGGWEGPGWKVFHTTKNEMPYDIITRGLFDSAEDAMLFRMRWT